MSPGQVVMLIFSSLFSIATLVVILELVLIGAPPRHCQHMVAVRSVPGVYACSERARTKAKP